MRYILKDKLAIPCDDLMEWAMWFGQSDRTVARSVIDGIVVSTVFLGLDHQHGKGEPLLFETMVFMDEKSGRSLPFLEANPVHSILDHMRRYSYWGDAEEGHRQVCEGVRQRIESSKATIQASLDKACRAQTKLSSGTPEPD